MRNETRRANHTKMWVSMQRRPTRDIDAEKEIQNGIAMDMFQRIAQAAARTFPTLHLAPEGHNRGQHPTTGAHWLALICRKIRTGSTSQRAM